MKNPPELASFLEPLKALQRLLTQTGNQGMIIGGIAASILGRPRLTADLDAVVILSVEKIPELLEQAKNQDIEPRINQVIEFAQKNRVLLLKHIPSSTNIDISLGILPFEVEAVQRSQLVFVATLEIRLPTPEDLIILKGVANRGKDLQDIQGIVAVHPDLDWNRIELWLKDFAIALDAPEIWLDVKKMRPF